MRFRKSVKFGGLRFNFSKSGIGVSTGVKGFRVGISPSKGRYYSYGISGSGIYDVKYAKKQKQNFNKESNKNTAITKNNENLPTELVSSTGCLWSGVTIFTLFAFFPLGFISLLGQLIWYFAFYKKTDKYKASKWYNEAKKEFDNGSYGRARVLLNQIDAIFPSIISVNKMIVKCFLAEESFKQALECMKKYCSTEQEKLELMEIAYFAKEYQTVIDYGQNLPVDLKKNVSVITILGASYYNLEKYEIALEVLLQGPTKKRKIDDEIANFRYFLGRTYEVLGQNKKAIQQYNKILAYNETFLDVKCRVENILQ